jgi:type II secretory pathway pseudopilin PulG
MRLQIADRRSQVAGRRSQIACQPASCKLQAASDRRPAFTLLEVVLAMTIGILLLAGLYVAVDVQLRHAQAGRALVEQSVLARALLSRIASDITPTLAAIRPSRSGSSGGSQPADTSSTTTATGGTTEAAAADPAMAVTATGAVVFNLNVQGDAGRLIVYVSRVARELTPAAAADSPPLVSDLRRITYWLADDGMQVGLGRQEVTRVTADDELAAVPPDVDDEGRYLLAPEVKSLTFSYWDGAAWQDVWDSTAPGADGTTPVGPPLAIAITVGLLPPASVNQADDASLKYFRHVVALPTANGLPLLDAMTAGTTPTTP